MIVPKRESGSDRRRFVRQLIAKPGQKKHRDLSPPHHAADVEKDEESIIAIGRSGEGRGDDTRPSESNAAENRDHDPDRGVSDPVTQLAAPFVEIRNICLVSRDANPSIKIDIIA